MLEREPVHRIPNDYSLTESQRKFYAAFGVLSVVIVILAILYCVTRNKLERAWTALSRTIEHASPRGENEGDDDDGRGAAEPRSSPIYEQAAFESVKSEKVHTPIKGF